MVYTTKQKKTIKAQFLEAGKDIIKGFTRGKSFQDIMQKQMKKERTELKAQGIELGEDAVFTGISWGLVQRLKDTSTLPSFLREEEEDKTVERLLKIRI